MQPARSLAEAQQRLQQLPLQAGDAMYQRLEKGRDTVELSSLEQYLKNCASNRDASAKCAFTGHRGSGKTTYLLDLAHRFQSLYTPIHICLDSNLESDCDYTDLLLWIVEEVTRQFKDRGHPVGQSHVAEIAAWFAQTSHLSSETWKKEFSLETNAEGNLKMGLPGLGFQLLARIKSAIAGSHETRREVRRNLQNRPAELLDRVNRFLEDARTVLRNKKKPDRILIIQDNLDRLSDPEGARRLFDEGRDILLGLAADVIYTAPSALRLAPMRIGLIFNHLFTMPNVKVRLRDGKPHKAGIDNLVELIGRRLSIPDLFTSRRVAAYLAEMSGGSVADLIRLLDVAQLRAAVRDKARIDQQIAREAVGKLRNTFQGVLIPANAYFPILASVHRTHKPPSMAGEISAERAEAARLFFAEMIGNGTILEYNGDDVWYDAHPAVQELTQFTDAFDSP